MRNTAHYINNLDMDCYEKYGIRGLKSRIPYFYLLRDEVCVHLRFCGLINFASLLII